MTPATSRGKGDRGQVGGIEVLPLGLLVFVSATLVLAATWGVVDARFAVASAAREATRAYVEADDRQAADDAAHRRATETLAAYGRDDGRATIADPRLSTPFGRCSRVSITVSYDVPAVVVPFLGRFGGLGTVTATHTEIVDPFRSGLAGPAQC